MAPQNLPGEFLKNSSSRPAHWWHEPVPHFTETSHLVVPGNMPTGSFGIENGTRENNSIPCKVTPQELKGAFAERWRQG